MERLVGGSRIAVGITADGEAYYWGSHIVAPPNGAPGNAFDGYVLPPQILDLSSPVETGSSNSGRLCLLLKDGSVECRGSNVTAYLGDGTTDSSFDAFRHVLLNEPAAQVGLAYGFGCALLVDGSVACWGGGGPSGDGPNGPQGTVPIAVKGLPSVDELRVGAFLACAFKQGGQLYCWGSEYYSDSYCGLPECASTTAVAMTDFPDVIDVAMNQRGICAIRKDGNIWCAGDASIKGAGRSSCFDVGGPPTKILYPPSPTRPPA